MWFDWRMVLVKKTSLIEAVREVIAHLKREMERLRWTDSMRDGLSVRSTPAVKGFPVRLF
jgi:hypothetical protein